MFTLAKTMFEWFGYESIYTAHILLFNHDDTKVEPKRYPMIGYVDEKEYK